MNFSNDDMDSIIHLNLSSDKKSKNNENNNN